MSVCSSLPYWQEDHSVQFRDSDGSTVKVGLSPALCVLSATLGNTLGGMTCYYMGRLGKISWIEKYFKVKKEKVDKMVNFLQGKGALMAFFAFLPAIGEVISIALGFMRSNIWLTVASMFAGKLIRYILLLYVLESAWNVVADKCFIK